MSPESTSEIGIIFDLDGTLLDSTGLISSIPKELEKMYSVTLDEATSRKIEDKILTTLKGKSGRFMIIRLILYVAKMYKVPWYLRIRYLKDAGKLYKEMIKSVRLFPGVRETMEYLMKQGISIAINTTSSKSELNDRFEERMDFLEMFNGFIITRSDITKLKPHPESIQILSNKMGIPIKNLIMVGDMDADIHAGKNAGCITVGVLCGYANRAMMEKYCPDFIIESLQEFPILLPQIQERISLR